MFLTFSQKHSGPRGSGGVVCLEVWRSAWAAVDCVVHKKVGLFGILLYSASACVCVVKPRLRGDLF